VSLTNWVTWSPPLPLRSKPVSTSPSPWLDHTPSYPSLFRFTAGGEHSRTTIQTPTGPKDVPNYALIQGAFIGAVATYLLFFTLIGPENHGSHFERGKTAFQAGASKEDVNSVPRDVERSSLESGDKEKGEVRQTEDRKQAGDNPV